MNQKLFSKDFTLVVIGQIISLFGNAALRFALPLYLLNQTGSSALYGAVMACAFIPAILLSPVGGIVADRVNKRNVMVILDFFTAAVILTFCLLMDGADLVIMLTVTLMILFGIAGAYQPSVQASIPALVGMDHMMAANSVVNAISSFSALLGPVLGGVLYSAYGLRPVLMVCMTCFVLSAVMEIFIHIPFQKQAAGGSMWKTVRSDFVQSVRFICKEQPIIGKAVLAVCGINLFLSSMITVALPYLTTEVLDLNAVQANRLYGYAEGILAAGGLAGGICAGVFAKRLSVKKAGTLIVVSAGCLFPVAASLAVISSGIANYAIMTAGCFVVMTCCTVFTIQMMTFFQTVTPSNLLGKVISVIITVAMCAQPFGSAMYGILFELCKGVEYVVVLAAGVVSLGIAVGMRGIFKGFSTSS